jgi:hypothetical protein
MGGRKTPAHGGLAPRRGLRGSLRAGAAYDLALALFIVTAGPATMARLGAPLSGDARFLFRLASLPLWILPALYLTAARSPNPDPFRPAVLWARLGGGFILIAVALLDRAHPLALFLAVGAADLLWGAIHALLWRARAAG